MRYVDHSALVPFAASDMYALVDNVTAYPDFLPWCQATTLLSRTDTKVIARLTVGFQALNTEFTTANSLEPSTAIKMELEDGPFSELSGQWSFEQLGDAGCKVSLQMQFEFASAVQDALLGASFERICDELIDAFINRAHATLASEK